MPAELPEKTDRYHRLLDESIDAAKPAAPPETPLHVAANECLEMASAYLEDGRHFLEADDPVNALAAFSYGHGWLDAGARTGILSVPTDTDLFTI